MHATLHHVYGALPEHIKSVPAHPCQIEQLLSLKLSAKLCNIFITDTLL